jgi:hypothetical protein
MPQYNDPPSITSLNPNDIILVWQTSSSSNKTITYANLLAEIKSDSGNTLNTVYVTADETLDGDEQFVVSNSGSAIVLTLPLSGSNSGKPIQFARLGAGALTIQRSGSDTISGDNSFSLDPYQTVTLTADGISTWFLAT